MNAQDHGEFAIRSESDIVMARKLVRHTATSLGFGVTEVLRIVTVASELTRNIYQYAGSGTMRWRSVTRASQVGIELVFEDQGPGIPDVAKALEMGFSTGNGLGLGLPGSKRLMDELTIQSEVGKGTRVEVRKWLRE